MFPSLLLVLSFVFLSLFLPFYPSFSPSFCLISLDLSFLSSFDTLLICAVWAHFFAVVANHLVRSATCQPPRCTQIVSRCKKVKVEKQSAIFVLRKCWRTRYLLLFISFLVHLNKTTWIFWDFPKSELKPIGISDTELRIPTPTTEK
jgi:hypothetical protein